MNKAFCQCCREHEWPLSSTATCRCGRVLEPQTPSEFAQRKQTHEEVGRRMLATDMEPLIHLFGD